jgi:hypothetical protein
MRKLARASRLPPLLALGLAAVSVNACSASSGHEFTGAGGAGASGGTVSGSSSGDIGFGAGHQGGSGSGAGGSGSCAAEPHVAMQIPLDMFIMLDQSGSMTDTVGGGGTKWDAVTGALTTFLQQPGLSGINVGIQYFGQPVSGGAQCVALTCATDADCGPAACGPCMLIIPGFGACTGASGGDSCNAADYATADVEIAPLPGVASAIISSLGQHSPTTSTPTSAALQGGIDHCKSWAGSHPGHAVVQVFATDGDPTECDTDQNHINAIAAAGASAKILTFVIGVGSSLTALNGVASAGGTGQAFIVDTNANANQQFLMALNAIRGAALGCQYDIPKPTQGMPDYGKVNVQYTPGGGGAPQVFDHYADKAHCPASGDGWYYDDNSNPTLINLCDATCNKVGGDATGKIDILLGCKTKDPA